MSANRPLSPHLQVYRLPLTGLISITHRMTGVLLSFALLLVVALLLALAVGESTYLTMQAWLANTFARLIYWGIVYALLFHLCHGIRHLLWDFGKTFAKADLDRFARYELAASLGLTALVFVLS